MRKVTVNAADFRNALECALRPLGSDGIATVGAIWLGKTGDESIYVFATNGHSYYCNKLSALHTDADCPRVVRCLDAKEIERLLCKVPYGGRYSLEAEEIWGDINPESFIRIVEDRGEPIEYTIPACGMFIPAEGLSLCLHFFPSECSSCFMRVYKRNGGYCYVFTSKELDIELGCMSIKEESYAQKETA